jgi:hypothetical protein
MAALPGIHEWPTGATKGSCVSCGTRAGWLTEMEWFFTETEISTQAGEKE